MSYKQCKILEGEKQKVLWLGQNGRQCDHFTVAVHYHDSGGGEMSTIMSNVSCSYPPDHSWAITLEHCLDVASVTHLTWIPLLNPQLNFCSLVNLLTFYRCLDSMSINYPILFSRGYIEFGGYYFRTR